MVTLTGECNQCGRCCEYGDIVCQYLDIHGEIGSNHATSCKVYLLRYNGMPVNGINRYTGRVVLHSVCYKDSPGEVKTIVDRGIGKGCSLTLVNIEDPQCLLPANKQT